MLSDLQLPGRPGGCGFGEDSPQAASPSSGKPKICSSSLASGGGWGSVQLPFQPGTDPYSRCPTERSNGFPVDAPAAQHTCNYITAASISGLYNIRKLHTKHSIANFIIIFFYCYIINHQFYCI